MGFNSDPPDRQFGEEGGRLSYGGYLRLPDLLAQRQPQSQGARAAMFNGELRQARHLFKRVHAVEQDERHLDRPRDADDEELARLRRRLGEPPLWDALLTHDETAQLWRTRHVQMVERQIGTDAGAPYLRGRTHLHYFPLLWELRAWL
ncbi:hypothetical protein [Nonomuraea typhae]|uniref:Uncharacterized protein n=1 Tax=Nonomuraea typhae TaxID=2603600 RepID=A0ABW7Z4J0_9ACTN